VELYEKIRREYEEDVGTILGVSKKLGIHRRMVRAAVRNAIPPARKKVQRESTRLVSEVVLFINQILAADQQAARKQCHTAQRVHRLLCEEMPQQPAEEFDLCEKLTCRVDAQGCVSGNYNRYSTPLRPETRTEVRPWMSFVLARLRTFPPGS
jgi:hypothetical protein